MSIEDPLWEKALAELNAGKPDPELWARCLSETRGNKSLAELQYLRDRAKQLADARRDQERLAKRARDDENLSQAMRIVESLPRGRCSNCQAIILLSAQACPKCLVSFLPGGGAEILPIDRTQG